MRAFTAASEACDPAPHLDDLSQTFVAQNQVIEAVRRRAVDERADLPIGSANPDVQRAHPDLLIRGDAGRRMVEKPDFTLSGDYTHGSHSGIGH